MLTNEEVLFQPPPVTLPVGNVGIRNAIKVAKINTTLNNNNNIHFRQSETVVRNKHLSVKYVYSKVTLYYNSRIELKWRRSLHHCQSCDNGYENGMKVPCGSIHYGLCTPAVPWSDPTSPAGSDISGSSQSSTGSRSGHSVSSSQHSPVDNQTFANGSSSKDKENLPAKDILQEREKERRDKEKEKQNTNINIQNNHVTQTIDNANSLKESRLKKRDNSRQQQTVIQNANLPKFHFPMGRPSNKDDTEEILLRVSQEFSTVEGGKIHKGQMAVISKLCGLPLFWKYPLFVAVGGGKQGFITYQMFSSHWRRMNQSCHDQAAQFVMLLAKSGTNYLEEDDFLPLLQDIVDSHPGLTFLQEAPEFHSRYVNTVIARIFYCVNRSWTGKITIPELRKSNFLQVLQTLEEEDDINQILEYFSYEHFYVIYCKFWELDRDHDLYIDRTDLARHNEHAINTRMIDRIFSGAVTRGKTFEEGRLSYPEFVWFLMSEEDKKHPTSVEYWFRCMDLDGDGVISMYEMEYFYEEQMQKMEALGIERLPFEDCLCQMLDLVQPEEPLRITLSDLKRCRMTNIFFDTFMNLDKFLEHEQRDPFANLRDLENDVPEPSDWERFAADEYEVLVAEEGANEQEEIHYEDDFEADDDEQAGNNPGLGALELDHGPRPTDPVNRAGGPANIKSNLRTIEDDIYDFSNTAAAKY